MRFLDVKVRTPYFPIGNYGDEHLPLQVDAFNIAHARFKNIYFAFSLFVLFFNKTGSISA